MKDPALGRTRAERALGETHPKAKKKPAEVKAKRSRLNEFRVIHHGQYDGPRQFPHAAMARVDSLHGLRRTFECVRPRITAQ